MSAFPPTHLDTERLTLRVPVFNDAHAIFAYASNPEVARYMLWRPHQTVEDSREFLGLTITNWAVGEGHRSWAVVERATGKLLGMVGVTVRGHAVELGYVLAPASWGQGITPEAVRAVMAAAFADPDIHRVWAVCCVDNVRSARVLEKSGFRFEGVLRSYAMLPNIAGTPHDHRCYARVRGDL